MSTMVIAGLVPNKKRMRRFAETSPSLITVLSPAIGYDKAAKIGKRLSDEFSIRDALKGLGYSDAEIDRLLNLKKLVGSSRK